MDGLSGPVRQTFLCLLSGLLNLEDLGFSHLAFSLHQLSCLVHRELEEFCFEFVKH